MALAFSSALFRPGAKLFPARLMNICTILMAEPIPPGDTSLRAMVRATSSGDLVKVPGGGKVDTVFTLADHFRLRLLVAIGVLSLIKKDFGASTKSRFNTSWPLQWNHRDLVKRNGRRATR